MPAQSNHLRYIEIKDFAPGLWERADWMMPPTAAQTMENCYPQEGGGLRAFNKASSLSVSGIADITKERVIGLHARGGIPARSGSPADLTDRYLMTYSFDSGAGAGSKARPKLYRMDGSNGETTWTQIFKTSGTTQFAFAIGDNNGVQKVNFRFFKLSSGSPDDQYVLFTLLYVGTDAGLYRLNYNDLSSAQKAIQITTSVTGVTTPSGPLAIHQARVMAFAGNSERLVYSDPGTVTIGAANFIDVEPSQDLPVPSAIHALAPSDLLVIKEGAPAVVVQGDITDPTVQALSEGIYGLTKQDFGRTPEGMTYIADDGYVYLTDGRTFNNISQQLRAFAQQANSTVSPGDTNYLNEFLFAPNGRVYHLPTKSWFTQTQLTGPFHNVERYTNQIWGPDTGSQSFELKQLVPNNRNDRVSTFTWKSAPLRSDDGRQIRIREVEVYARSYDSSATVAVTVNGTTVTKTLASSSKQSLRFLFNERAEVLDVQVVSTAGSGSNEAPSIETLRIGVGTGHLSL